MIEQLAVGTMRLGSGAVEKVRALRRLAVWYFWLFCGMGGSQVHTSLSMQAQDEVRLRAGASQFSFVPHSDLYFGSVHRNSVNYISSLFLVFAQPFGR